MSTSVCIGIAVVIDSDRVLVGIRGTAGPLPGKHEFPGGKCLPGESVKTCAVRECREETGLDVEAVGLLLENEHSYDFGTVKLSFFECRVSDAEQHPDAPFAWWPLDRIAEGNWPDGNQQIIARLLERPSL